MVSARRIKNILKYGFGPEARRRKQRDKAEARAQRFAEATDWDRSGELIARRYESYEAYVRHQSDKLAGVTERLRENEAEDLAEFTRRFQSCDGLEGARVVLCLGARLGTEVRALQGLGHFAVGIDLNPGPSNAYVLSGDFHRIVFPDGSVDAIYTNALDHVFDLPAVLAEVNRLLRPGGRLIVDMVQGFEEGFVPGRFEATHWPDTKTLIERIQRASGLEIESSRELGRLRRDHWTQAVFRMPGGGPS